MKLFLRNVVFFTLFLLLLTGGVYGNNKEVGQSNIWSGQKRTRSEGRREDNNNNNDDDDDDDGDMMDVEDHPDHGDEHHNASRCVAINRKLHNQCANEGFDELRGHCPEHFRSRVMDPLKRKETAKQYSRAQTCLQRFYRHQKRVRDEMLDQMQADMLKEKGIYSEDLKFEESLSSDSDIEDRVGFSIASKLPSRHDSQAPRPQAAAPAPPAAPKAGLSHGNQPLVKKSRSVLSQPPVVPPSRFGFGFLSQDQADCDAPAAVDSTPPRKKLITPRRRKQPVPRSPTPPPRVSPPRKAEAFRAKTADKYEDSSDIRDLVKEFSELPSNPVDSDEEMRDAQSSDNLSFGTFAQLGEM